jgi:hypothetical protein
LASDEEAVRETPASAAGMLAAAGLNELAESRAREMPGGRDSGKRAGEKCEQGTEEKDHAIHLDGGFVRERVVGDHGGKSANAEIGGENPQDSTSDGNEKGFGEELLDEAGTLSANGYTYSKFVLTGGAASEKKYGDVGATDKEQGQDRAEEKNEGAGEAAEDFFVERDDDDATIFAEILGIGLGKAVKEDLEFGGGSGTLDAGFEPYESVPEIMGIAGGNVGEINV